MRLGETLASSVTGYLRDEQPEQPVYFFSPSVLKASAKRFLDGFPGLVTYAVKANPDRAVLLNLYSSGIRAFDVASPSEIALLRKVAPDAVLHYHNPVRALSETEFALRHGVTTFSVDSVSELKKLAQLADPKDIEASIRFKTAATGAAYDFGEKFGASPEMAAQLLQVATELGFETSLTFHPGTQCNEPAVWREYIQTAAKIAKDSGCRIWRLNTGGGFPSKRFKADEPRLDDIFEVIRKEAELAFGANIPELVCEPGRAMVAESFSVATRVKAVRDGGDVFLNDGIYGGLIEQSQIGVVDRISVVTAAGAIKQDRSASRRVFGPTCDSIDKFPGHVPLPDDIEEGDFMVFHGLGAYSRVTVTDFNGFGDHRIVTVSALDV